MSDRSVCSARKSSILLSLVLVGVSLPVSSQETSSKAVQEFATSSLRNYVQNLLTSENVTRYGFENLKDAQTAQLGEPLRVMLIGLMDLKAYREGSAKRLLRDTKTFWFPVTVRGQTLSKLEVIEKEGRLIAGEFGGFRSAQQVAAVRRETPRLLEAKGVQPPYEISLVKVPALAAVFLGVEGAGGEYLIPAMAQPERFRLENAEIYQAGDVLKRLSEVAQKVDEKKVW